MTGLPLLVIDASAALALVLADEEDGAARSRVWSLGRAHELSYYDAAYLELARRLRCRLKTSDRHILALKPRYAFIQ